ncbi:MAG: hypothetical protein SF052_10565 [Bacteroidia bacterium]|nr:hypothetical protein [Bacteroidia bacterium]
MLRRDYFLKMIEEAGYVLARLLGLRQEGRYQEALELVNDIYKDLFPFDPDLVHHTKPEDLPDLLRNEYNLTEEHLAILADLLRAEADLWYDRGVWEKATLCLQRSLALIQYLDDAHPEEYSFDRIQKLAEITEKLKDALPPDSHT